MGAFVENAAGVYAEVSSGIHGHPDSGNYVVFVNGQILSIEAKLDFTRWLYRIAYNESLMRLRKKKLDTVSLDRPVELEEGDVSRDLADWTTDPRADVMNNELDPDNRIVFLMRDVHGLSTNDTADALGLSIPAVKSRLHRARLFLRGKLSDYFDHGTEAGEATARADGGS